MDIPVIDHYPIISKKYNIKDVFENIQVDTVFGLLLQSYLELITNLEGDTDFNKSNTTSFTIKLGNIVTRYFFRKLYHDYCMSEVENNKKSFVT